MRAAHKIKQKEHRARQIQQELTILCRARCNLGDVPLQKPIRNGWYKHLVMRTDISRRKDAHIFQEILDVCARWVWGSDKKMADKRWLHNIKHNRDWQWAGLAWITKDKYKLLSPKAKTYFVEYEWKWTPWQGSIKRYYCHVPKYYFVTAYEKAYITHRRVVDSQLERKIAELENQLLSNELYSYSWNATHYWMNKWWRKRDTRKIRHRTKTALKAYDEEKYDQLVGKALM